MRSTALGRHLMRFISLSPSSSSFQSAGAAAAGGASTSAACLSSIVSLRSSSTFRGSSRTRSLRAAHSSSSRLLAPSALRAMSSCGAGRTNVAAAATAAGATDATAAVAVAAATTDAANAAAAAPSSSPQTRRGAALDAVLAPLEAVVGPLSREPMVPPPAPLVLVVSGPSGVGKDAAIRALHAARPGLRFVVTATSRERRPGEVDGVDYSFVSKAEFEGMVSRGELLEHAVVYGEYKGIPRKAVEAALEAARRDAEREVAILRGGAEGEAAAAPSPASPSSSSPPPAPPSGAGVVVLRLDVQGAATVRALLPARSLASVFLAAESEAALAARLAARGTEGAGALATRVATARHEAARAAEFDFVVVNAEGDVEGTVGALGAIVDAERCRSSRRLPPTPPPRPPASS